MKNIFKLVLSIIGCELVGMISTPFTIQAIPNWYAFLNKPFFSPPNWIFGPVWTLLYCLMGISFYLIIIKGWKNKSVQTAAKYFLAQLALNFIWSPVFFALRSPLLALIIVIALWVTIVITMTKFYPLSKVAFYLLVPYLLWVSFASMLNAAIWMLN